MVLLLRQLFHPLQGLGEGLAEEGLVLGGNVDLHEEVGLAVRLGKGVALESAGPVGLVRQQGLNDSGVTPKLVYLSSEFSNFSTEGALLRPESCLPCHRWSPC